MIRLKAALKALSDSYPSESAIAEIRSPELVSLSPANSIRHRVKYSIGDVPTVSLNFSASLIATCRCVARAPVTSNGAPDQRA